MGSDNPSPEIRFFFFIADFACLHSFAQHFRTTLSHRHFHISTFPSALSHQHFPTKSLQRNSSQSLLLTQVETMSSNNTEVSHEDPPVEAKRFQFTAEQLKEIRSFRCLHPNSNNSRGLIGRHEFYNLKKWKVVPYTVCEYGLFYNDKEIRPISDSDDALILGSIVGDLHFQDSFGSVMKKLHNSAYTVNAAALMRRHFDAKDKNIVSSIKTFVARFKQVAEPPSRVSTNNDDVIRLLAEGQNKLVEGQNQLRTNLAAIAERQATNEEKTNQRLVDIANRQAEQGAQLKAQGDSLRTVEKVVSEVKADYAELKEQMHAMGLARLDFHAPSPMRKQHNQMWAGSPKQSVHVISDTPHKTRSSLPDNIPLTKNKLPCKTCIRVWEKMVPSALRIPRSRTKSMMHGVLCCSSNLLAATQRSKSARGVLFSIRSFWLCRTF